MPEAPPAESAVESDSAAVDTMVEELVDEVSASTEPVGGADNDDLEEQAAAAVKIQAVHRGKQARKELQEKREQEAAAVKIQAVHRGKQARKELEEKRRDVPEAPPEELVAREDPSTTDPVRTAFDKFDADGSDKLERGELLKVLEELGLDVSDGEFVAFAEALMEDYDADGNGELDFEEFKKLYAQCLESDETRKAYVEELRAAVGGLVGGALSAVVESDAAAKIQAVHRGKQARKELQEKREQEAAAVKIQAVHRGKQARKELEEKRRDVPEAPPAESAVESDSAAVDTMVEELVDEVSASTEPVGGADNDDLEEQAAAAVKIQAVHRGKQARKELQEKREQEAAAVKIQAVHRGKQARKELEEKREMESAALKIQAVHRGKQTRMELRKERERDAVLKPASSNRKNKVAPMPPGRDGKEDAKDASDASDALYFSEDENGHARAEDVAVRAASSLVGANAQLAGALEAAAAVSNRPSAARFGGADARGSARGAPGLSKHMVNDLAKRLPSLCGGGRGGEMEALKLIAAVVATRRRRSNVRSNKVAPLDAA